LSRLLAAALPEGATLTSSTLRPWASANFVGARHIFQCEIAGGPAPAALQDRLGVAEWALRGHIVADVAVEPAAAGGFAIEILTVED
jgi:hypothetical protein